MRKVLQVVQNCIEVSLKVFQQKDGASSSDDVDHKGRRIIQDSRDRWVLMLPFIVWAGTMVGIYSVSEEMMVTLPSLLSELNGIKYCVFGVDRTAFLANVRPLAVQ